MKARRIKEKPYEASENFRRWVSQVGPYRLAGSMGVSYRSVCRWVADNAQRPRFQNALSIVALSQVFPLRGHGALILADVIGMPEVGHAGTK